MVAFKYSLPLIQNEQGLAVAFESDWLKAALDHAAQKAGYDGWWLSDEFSAAIAQYFRQDYVRSVIELSKLERVVRATLRDVGYEEIAARFRVVNPFQSISLAECLKASIDERKSTFFQRLAERIEAMHAAKVRHFHFYDLQTCVQKLLEEEAASVWWNTSLMRARVVTFVRERLQALSWQAKIDCTIHWSS